MKKYILILTILSLTLKVGHSQTNIFYPLPDSIAIWTESATGIGGTDCPPPPYPNPVLNDYSFSYFLQGDTIINSYTYHKIYQSGSVHEHCSFGNTYDIWMPISKNYQGAYRQDTVLKRIYFISSSSGQECLLYDFNLIIGDTVNAGCQNLSTCAVTVTSIDSILIENNYRKRFNLSQGSASIIEGIGSTLGLLEPFCQFEYYSSLICFSQNGQTLYPDTTTNCDIITHVNEIKEQSAFSIFPNPFINFTTIQFKSASFNIELNIYNVFGQLVKEIKNIYGQTFELQKDNLQSGVYFIRLVQDNKTIATDKILIIE